MHIKQTKEFYVNNFVTNDFYTLVGFISIPYSEQLCSSNIKKYEITESYQIFLQCNQ